MATDNNNRTDESPQDPKFGWRGVNTDLRNRPTPNQLDELRRAAQPTPPAETKIVLNSLGGLMETAVEVPKNEVAALCYNAGISDVLARRIVAQEHAMARRFVALERAMENPLLLQTVTELANGYGELTVQIAELRQAIAALQAKKK